MPAKFITPPSRSDPIILRTTMCALFIASTAFSAAAFVVAPTVSPIGPRSFTAAAVRGDASMCLAASTVSADGKTVDVSFDDGSAFRFHSLWLRDACRDSEHVAGHAGERYLTATPVGPSGVRPDRLAAKEATVGGDGLLHISWTEDSFGAHEMAADPPRDSTFPSDFLRTYASSAAECLAQPTVMEAEAPPPADADFAFLAPYTGFRGARAPAPK